MIQSFIILFREVLEISIILSIIMAATRGVPNRLRFVGLGVAGGVVGASIIAYFAQSISNAMEGMGQEFFNAGILAVAVLMIGWTVVWMQTHGREIAQKMKQVGSAVKSGDASLYSLAVVVSLAMWREGAEIVLFMTGILATSTEPMVSIIMGGLAGAALATVIGAALYFGLIRLSTKYLFLVTSWLLILLACGMSAGVAGYLNAADMLPALGQMWDSSWLLSQDSVLGKILHAMLGYSERPSGIQLIFFATTLGIILFLQKLTKRTA